MDNIFGQPPENFFEIIDSVNAKRFAEPPPVSAMKRGMDSIRFEKMIIGLRDHFQNLRNKLNTTRSYNEQSNW